MSMHLLNSLALAALQTEQPEALTGTSQTLEFLDLPQLWVLVLVLLPLLALVAFVGYWKESLATRSKVILTTLRFGSLLLLLLVLFRPVFEKRREEVLPAEVVILVDDSASMRRRDAYTGNAQATSTVKRLSPTASDVQDPTRLAIAKAALEKELLPHLRNNGYEPRLFRFSEALTPLQDWETATGSGNATHLGSAIQKTLAYHRGRHVTDILLVSDGRNNGGTAPAEAARSSGVSGIPVHALTLGDTRPIKNLILELIEAPASALAGDEIAISIRLSGRGVAANTPAEILLVEIGQDGSSDRVLAVETASVDREGTRVVLTAPPNENNLDSEERRFRVSVEPVEDETLLDDNQLEITTHITTQRIRVLYIDGYPRWEYRYLKNLLLRADENLEMQVFLLSATVDFVQESSPGLPALTSVPISREELLESYDVVILGDVSPSAISPDPAKCDEFMASLREFVQRGGGLLMQAGEYDNPRDFVDTPLEELVPVVLDSTGTIAFEGNAKEAFRPVLELPSTPHEIVRLHPDTETNRRLWEEEDGLRGQYWFSPVVRSKPGTQTLLRHPTAGNSYGRYPLLVTGYFPSGRTMFLGIDSTWMWRYHFGDRYHERFWRNSIRWLALGRLRSGDRRVRLDSLHATYNLDERVVLEARVLDEDFRPSEVPTQTVYFEDPWRNTEELALELVDDRPGLYRASFDVQRPGAYKAWTERDGKRNSSTEFEVILPSHENSEPEPDPKMMELIASISGGSAVEVGSLSDLKQEFPGDEERRQPISSQLEDAWDNWASLLILLTLLSIEWIMRKRLELI